MKKTNEPTREALLRAFRPTPPAFEAGVDETLRRLTSETEGKQVKRKLAFAPALVLALVLLASVAVAAALYPKTADRLRDFYGEELAAQVETYGMSAELGQSVTLGEVKYTVTDAIWNAGILYGTVVAEPVEGANALLIAGDMAVDGPVGYNPGYGETAPEGTKSYAETAKETGAKILLAAVMPDGLLAGGALLSGDVGVTATVTGENTVVTTFELGGAQEADSYAVRIRVANWQLSPEGEALDETRLQEAWDVTVTPAAPEDAAAPGNAPDIEGALELDTPAAYAQSGTMPVYSLTARDFTQTVDPAWFNASGEQSREGNTTVTFRDGATLMISREAIFYEGHEGTTTFHGYDGSEYEHPANDLAGKLADLARTVYSDERMGRREKEPARDAIPALTRAEAMEMLDALLHKLGIENAAEVWSYGMDAGRIRELGAERDAAIAKSGGEGFDDPYDLSAVTEDDGGWLLVCGMRIGGVCVEDDSLLSVSAFVNRDGVANLSLRSMYAPGEEIETPEALLTAEEALAKAAGAAKKSWIPEMAGYLAHASGAQLLYAPSTTEGLQLVPAWRISAKDTEDGSTFAVDVSAVDGAVLDAPWM